MIGISIGGAWLYARKSDYHGKKGGRGRSVDEQLVEGRGWCEDYDVPVNGVYVDDDRSASPMAAEVPREEFERLLGDIGSGLVKRGDVVVAWDSARVYRDLKVYVSLREACVRAGVFLCYKGEFFDLSRRSDRKRTAYDAVDAEDRAWEIAEQVQRSLRGNARLGRPHSRVPYGYIRRYDPRTGDLLDVIIHEEHAAIVREIFERVAAHETHMSIVDDLNARGIPSPSDSCCNRLIGVELQRLREEAGLQVGDVAEVLRWKTRRLARVEAGTYGLRLDDVERMCELYAADEVTAAGLVSQWRSTPQWIALSKKMLKNEAYIGRRSYRGKDVAPAIWPAIVEPEVFHAVQLILADPERRTQKTTETTHLLAGLGVCGVEGCGGICRSGGMPMGYPVYKCNGKHCFQVRAEVVEQYVVAQLVIRFARRDAAELFAVRGTNDERIRELKANIVRWEADLAEAAEKVAARELSVGGLVQLEGVIAPMIKKAQGELGRARINPLLAKLIKPNADAEAVYAEWQRMQLAQQRAVIQSELEITISPVGKGRRRRPVEEYVELSWRRPAAA